MVGLLRHNKELNDGYRRMTKENRDDYCVSLGYLRHHPMMCVDFAL